MTPPYPPYHASREANMRAAGEMVLAAFGFATMSAIAHGFRGQVPWPAVAFARISVTMVIMLALVWWWRIPFRVWDRQLWWRSVLGVGGLLCNFYALSRLPITEVVTILSTAPIWVTVILWLIFHQRVRWTVWVHALLAAGGVYIMNRPSFSSDAFPLLVACGAAVIIASAKVALARVGHLPPVGVVAHYSLFATAVCGVLTLTVPDGLVATDPVPAVLWWWILPMGLAGTAAQFLLTTAYGRGTTTMVALVGLSQIAFAAAYDFIIWGHTIDGWKAAGIGIIAVAITLSVTSRAAVLPVEEAIRQEV
jgi:drug/metabolite transporter (DMT)-like permease